MAELSGSEDLRRAEAWLELVVRRPRTVVAATLLVTLLAGAGLLRLRIETSGHSLVPEDHPAVEADRRLAESFGRDETLVVAMVAPGGAGSVLEAGPLALLSRLTRRLGDLEGVAPGGASSLATVEVAVQDGGTLRVSPLLGDAGDGAGDGSDALAERLETDRSLDGLWISADRSAATILLRLDPRADRRALVRLVRGVLDEEGRGRPESLHLAGAPVAEEMLGEHVLEDLARMLPLVVGVLALALFLVFRSPFQVLVPLAEAGCSIVVALGTLAWCGRPLTLVTAIAPVILVGLAVADEVHLFERYAALRRARTGGGESPEGDPHRLVVEAVLELWWPLVFTSLTTALGFLAFLTTSLAAVRDFGLFTAVGILAALAMSLSFVPACLVLGEELEASRRRRSLGRRPIGRRTLDRRTLDPRNLGHRALAVGAACRRHRGRVLAACGLFVLLSPLAVGRIRVQDSWVGNFDPDSPLARADRVINQHFLGTHRLRVVVDTGEREGVYDPALLRQLEELQGRLESLDEVGGTLSLVDLLERSGGWREDGEGLPASPSEVAEALLAVSFLRGPEGLAPVVDPPHRRLHLSVFLRHADYRRTARVVEAVRGFAREHWGERVSVELGGDARVSQAAVESVVGDQLRGLLGALVGVVLLLAALLRSPKSALVVVTPIALAVLLNLAVLGLAGIPLGIATSMFSAVSVGIGVDYALHLWWWDRHRGSGSRTEDGTEKGSSVARAVTVNALVVSAGFLALLLSRTPPVRSFGTLVAVAMGASLLFAVTVLPALTTAPRPAAAPTAPPTG